MSADAAIQPAKSPWRVVILLLGCAFFALVAAVHAISATGAGSIPALAALWLLVPAPLVFLGLGLAGGARERWRWLARSYLALDAVLAVAVLAIVGWVGSERALHPSPCENTPILEEFPDLQKAAEVVSFQVPGDGQRMGWYIPGDNGASVLLLHGYGCRRQQMLDHAQVLYNAGYSTLLFDFRNRGDSDGDAVTLGFYEQKDALAAVEYLRSRSDVDMSRLGVVGLSMGASVAILAAAQAPEIKAVVADSPFQSARQAVDDGFSEYIKLPDFPFAPITVQIIKWREGISPGDVSPIDHVAGISPRPLLLIHGLGDTRISPRHSQRLYQVAGEPKELWLLPGSDHVAGINDYPEEYPQRMLEFLGNSLR